MDEKNGPQKLFFLPLNDTSSTSLGTMYEDDEPYYNYCTDS